VELNVEANTDSMLVAMHCFISTASRLNMFPLVAQSRGDSRDTHRDTQ
jgi:hypothetical protein